mmetsp:Transcript_4015/g.13106  ORF Transcript_4015/g.13106 Transcript_4015/m.13106 type:complete len:149 (+) Transcript_4015:324-770(+)
MLAADAEEVHFLGEGGVPAPPPPRGPQDWSVSLGFLPSFRESRLRAGLDKEVLKQVKGHYKLFTAPKPAAKKAEEKPKKPAAAKKTVEKKEAPKEAKKPAAKAAEKKEAPKEAKKPAAAKKAAAPKKETKKAATKKPAAKKPAATKKK